jgi:hypothetical protein
VQQQQPAGVGHCDGVGAGAGASEREGEGSNATASVASSLQSPTHEGVDMLVETVVARRQRERIRLKG